jgi:hypothetical protein
VCVCVCVCVCVFSKKSIFHKIEVTVKTNTNQGISKFLFLEK